MSAIVNDNEFVSAIDNHNVANGDGSWLEKKIESTGDFFSGVGQAVTYGAAASLVAGVNSIVNTAADVGSFMGMDTEQTSTHDVLKSLDDNLAAYYDKHEQGVEIAGFLAGAIIPGTAGIKALQAAKAGVMGINSVKSLGLMTSLTRDYSQLAKAEFALTQTPFTFLNSNVIKGLAQGYGNQVLEAGAFNIAATAAMYKSPTLSQQSVSDLFWDNVEGSLVWGGIGGTVVGATGIFGIKRAITDVKKELLPQSFITQLPNKERVEPILGVLNSFKNKFDLPEAMGPLKVEESLGITGDQLLVLKGAAREKTLQTIEGDIRRNLNTFAGEDTLVGNALYEATKNATKFEDILQSLGPAARSAGRIGTEDTLAATDVYFLNHGAKYEKFQDLLKAGTFDEIFTGKGTDVSQGFQIVGDLSALKVTGAKSAGVLSAGAKEDAFQSGFDVFRNPNGTYSVNPNSKILLKVTDKPIEHKILIDLEDGATVKFRGTPGLSDLATKDAPIVVRGDVVLAGKLNPIKMGKSSDFNPINPELMPHEVQARTIWAQTAKITDGMRVGANDLPFLERLYHESVAGTLERKQIYIVNETGQIALPDAQTLKGFILERKQKLMAAADGMPVEELSARLNAKDKFFTEGTEADWLKIQPGMDYNIPRYAKVTYDPKVAESLPMMNANAHMGALEYARQVEAVRERVKQNFTNYTKDFNAVFPEGFDPYNARWNTAAEGAGAGILGFANASYGTMASWAQSVGIKFEQLLLNKKTATAKQLNNSFAALTIDEAKVSGATKTAEAALINNKLLRSSEGWKFHPDGSNTLVKAKEFDAIAKGEIEATEEIKIQSSSVAEFFKDHISINGERQGHIGNMKGSAGVTDNFDPTVLYPIPVSTQNLKHFVLVKPRAPVSLSDKTRVIAAKDEATLQKLIAEVDRNEFIVQTKAESEAWHKNVGDYEFALGLNDSSIDSALKREGKLSQHFPTIDEGFLDRSMEWHMRQEELLARSMVYHRYSQEFEELKQLGKQHVNVGTSQFGFISKGLEQAIKDPYNDVIKTALNISRSSEYQPWINFNNFVKDTIEGPINKLRDIWKDNPQIDQNFVNKVNAISEEMGQVPPFNTAMSMLIANGNVPSKPWLSLTISKAQSVLSTTLLQWDTFNALNNMLGNVILSGPEMKSVLSAISKGDTSVAGRLTELMTVKVPGQEFTMPTTKKLIKNAIDNYTKNPEITDALVARYRGINTITDLTQEARQSFNRLAIDWRTVTEVESKTAIEKAADFGRKWTGNAKAEEFNRFIASDVMRQVTDLAEQAKILTRAESDEYIQMFVNRTQGNQLYSQRPIVFQGVVGQAISLFQTYQFNLMQQLLRYTASGESKSAAMMMGLQGSIYGLNGLPAFNFLNTHIIGNAEGNTRHTDITQGTYQVFGKDMAEWVLYGAGSNALGLVDPRMKINLYSRGDINPRQLTVLPTQLADIPVVSASVKFVTNLYNAADKIDQGGSFWNSMSQAIEHNGISRPLAGLGQIVQGYSTTNQGSLLTGGQDFFDVATLTRLAGGKPFNEAVALDALYRINAYKAKDDRQRASLGSAIKTTLVGGGNPTPDQVTNFAMSYAKAGGKIENFQKFFATEALNANRSQVNAIATNLSRPVNQQIQEVMGGVPLPDFTNTKQ